jgi:hypothetical protein
MPPPNTTPTPQAPINIAAAHAKQKANMDAKAKATKAKAKTTPKPPPPPPPKVVPTPAVPAPANDRLGQKDYMDAHTYITDFYSRQYAIADSLWETAADAVNQFFIVTTRPETALGANIAYQLIRVALGILPTSSVVISLFEKMGKGQALAKSIPAAKKAARMTKKAAREADKARKAAERAAADAAKVGASRTAVVAQRTAAGTYVQLMQQAGDGHLAALYAKDFVMQARNLAKEEVENERDDTRADFDDYVNKYPEKWGSHRAEVVAELGPITDFSADEINAFGRRYEAELYKIMYKDKGWISEATNNFTLDLYIKVEGVPKKVLERMVQLTRAASQLAAVQDWNLKRHRTRWGSSTGRMSY